MNRLTQPHHGAMPPPPGAGLARYGSAPGSFLAAIADSVTCGGEVPQQQMPVSRFFSGESSGLTSCESSCRTDVIHVPPPAPAQVGLGGGSGSGSDASGVPLFRHSSSPAGLLSRLMADPHGTAGNGMGGARGLGTYSQAGSDGAASAMAHRRLSSQWSFSRQDMMPQISEMGIIPDNGESITGGGCNSSSDGAAGHGAQSSSYGLSRNFSMSSWDDTNSIMFSSPSKKAKVDAGDDIFTSFSNIDSSLEMPRMDDYLQMQQDSDSVACRVRAKRGCATHPRSIAERERRTRISKRLRKLQDLVPNMDKQTNTSDMLDIAVDYIKELQGQVEKLKHDQANCTCSGNQNC